MKEFYECIELESVLFPVEDVIVTSLRSEEDELSRVS